MCAKENKTRPVSGEDVLCVFHSNMHINIKDKLNNSTLD